MVDLIRFEVDRVNLIVDTYVKVAERELDHFTLNGPIFASNLDKSSWVEVVKILNKENEHKYTMDYGKDELRIDFNEK